MSLQTIGGNLLSANPKYDLSSVLAALNCSLHVISKGKLASKCLHLGCYVSVFYHL